MIRIRDETEVCAPEELLGCVPADEETDDPFPEFSLVEGRRRSRRRNRRSRACRDHGSVGRRAETCKRLSRRFHDMAGARWPGAPEATPTTDALALACQSGGSPHRPARPDTRRAPPPAPALKAQLRLL